MTEYILYWLIAANGIAFILMVVDKRRAETGGQRISESTLLGWAFFGGATGAFAASRLVRHKTRKQPFAAIMIAYLGLQFLLLGLWLLGLLDPLAATALAYWRAAS
ncbi:hypothetical protein BWQ93_01710 [Sphingopyxis sp. QXT-31]|uniref:DUF1294 domain-containing protein n=1 Tax=Sphingopyxis sp. QXT-31 TaxID=1357916 RepID=UPI0009796EC4|nr:DUF1294 domain-containing protein [Sphingopyxis sp. QXT-31]APZ97349.1 hypothetical protein BWQ93_01710 [Sphingopyxis sp. QXT-31]